MTTVTGTLIGLPAPQRVEMKASLVDVTGKPAVGYVPTLSGELVKDVPFRAGEDGAWEIDLTPNSLVDSVAGDTLWAIQEGRTLDGSPILTHVVVPEAAGPWWVGDIRVELADAPEGTGGTVIYLPGPAGTGYRHTQDTPASTWQIPHNLGYRPTISLALTDGRVVLADIVHSSPTLAVVQFPTPIAGTATCS
jgi:hypothetical protein